MKTLRRNCWQIFYFLYISNKRKVWTGARDPNCAPKWDYSVLISHSAEKTFIVSSFPSIINRKEIFIEWRPFFVFGAAITNPIKWAIVPPTLFSRFYFHFLHNWEEARRFLIWYGLVCATLLFMVIRWYFVGFCESRKCKDAIKKWVGCSHLIRVINLHLKITS